MSDLAIDNQKVDPEGFVEITGSLAARTVSGRIAGKVPPGHKLFVVTNPLTGTAKNGLLPGDGNYYVQGELRPGSNGRWRILVHILTDGYFTSTPDRVWIVLADATNSQELENNYMAAPGERPAVDTGAVNWDDLTYIDVLKKRA